MRRRTGDFRVDRARVKWLRATERCLLLVGLLLLGFYGMMRLLGTVGARVEMERFTSLRLSVVSPADVVPERKQTNKLAWLVSNLDFGLWSQGRIQAYENVLSEQFPPPEAVLSIPRIQLEVPVLEGTDELTLNRAVGRIEGTARIGEAGNVGIAGHRDGFFRGLKELIEGDVLDLMTPRGTFSYEVDRILIVDPEDVEVLETRLSPSLTLVTCYPFYFVGAAPKRYIVQASLLTGDLPQSTTAIVLKDNFTDS